ncbi:hypothetical protein [Shouchella lehensis]|uniref:hypothetical protein n=1 Tax=Shouchella lehensis TaxID=300825 RepID=UPI001ABB15A1|nr:hypothetical protein [Shouchella lehensis]
MLLMFAVGIPLILILILSSPMMGLTVVAVILLNWFFISHYVRKHHRDAHSKKECP